MNFKISFSKKEKEKMSSLEKSKKEKILKQAQGESTLESSKHNIYYKGESFLFSLSEEVPKNIQLKGSYIYWDSIIVDMEKVIKYIRDFREKEKSNTSSNSKNKYDCLQFIFLDNPDLKVDLRKFFTFLSPDLVQDYSIEQENVQLSIIDSIDHFFLFERSKKEEVYPYFRAIYDFNKKVLYKVGNSELPYILGLEKKTDITKGTAPFHYNNFSMYREFDIPSINEFLKIRKFINVFETVLEGYKCLVLHSNDSKRRKIHLVMNRGKWYPNNIREYKFPSKENVNILFLNNKLLLSSKKNFLLLDFNKERVLKGKEFINTDLKVNFNNILNPINSFILGSVSKSSTIYKFFKNRIFDYNVLGIIKEFIGPVGEKM